MQQSFWIFNGKLTILIDEQDTNGSYDLIEGTFAPGIDVPPHQHHQYSELIMVKEGELSVYQKGQVTVLQPGEFVFIPKSTPHAVCNTGTTEAIATCIASPSGFARLIREVGLPGKADGSAPDEMNDMELFLRISAELGDEMLGAPGTRP
ncbi:cupin domain-containing protein [Chitinophaga pendula]|uniref:cupin domain-containing protein n=1 Tax=Chitinophaga TaxID=79328 RepID=UPI000BAF6B08|nr:MULTISPECIES: cupin domain-containing protein [Chitinophaga]ASZ13304.1 cupin [Chitinophaga sp. MD30]UCJ09072.1 cupin domain-containing protein [Chitinophaga pendula]